MTATTAPTTTGAGIGERRPTSARMLLVLAAIVLGALGNLANLLFGFDEGRVSVSFAAEHPSAWAAATYGNALLGLGLIALFTAVCVLARQRGSGWATVTLAVGSLGTFLLTAAAAIPAGLIPIGTQDVISTDQANALVEYLQSHDLTQAGVAFPGFLLLLVTQITLTVALIRSRAVPLWVPIVFLAGGIVETLFAGNGALTAALTVPQLAAEVAIGVYALKRV
jgi:hypothetical protein